MNELLCDALDARASRYACRPSALLGVAPGDAGGWPAALIDEACYQSGERTAAVGLDKMRHDKIPVFPAIVLRSR